MKKSKTNMNKVNEFNILFVNLQLIFTVIVVVLFILGIFDVNVSLWLQLALFFTLLIMAYNNKIIYNRKNMSIVYICAAGVVLITFILILIGVV